MILNYETALHFAQELKYEGFTPLQEKAFSDPRIYDINNDFFVLGETSTGKTLIPLLRYYLHLKKAKEEALPLPKLLFIVPYRALAAQKKKEIQTVLEKEDLRIAQSTGEFRQDDELIQCGQVDIAVIIAEKIYKFISKNDRFLSQYDYMVIDEIGLINDVERGGRIDFLLLWARRQKTATGRPSVMALGTPFYDWSEYIQSYGFCLVAAEQRPVKLKEYAVYYSRSIDICNLDGSEASDIPPQCKVSFVLDNWINTWKDKGGFKTDCDAHPDKRCPVEQSCRTNQNLPCRFTSKVCNHQIKCVKKLTRKIVSDYILVELCRWHLSQNHQILIFQNDREQVRQLCLRLYENLKELLPPPEKNARDEILEKCQVDPEDFSGIMDSKHYDAFSSGIAFHSAALPNELRSYVEEGMLESRKLKIVCSTETLAFGVNSTVDTVIIASLIKSQYGSQRFLTLNEYKNYAGRAGRLRKKGEEKKSQGYVYSLINSNKEKNALEWEKLQSSECQTLYSRFYNSENGRIPFYLLNMFPLDNDINLDGILKAIEILPRPNDYTIEDLDRDSRAAIRFLKREGMIIENEPQRRPRRRRNGREASRHEEKKYLLTPLGKSLRGYILSMEDYKIIRNTLKASIHGVTLDKQNVIYELLQTKHLEDELRGAFRDADQRLEKEELIKYFSVHKVNLSEESIRLIKNSRNINNLRLFYVFGALLGWCNGMSANDLYRNFGVLYPLIQKTGEQLGYLLEICKEVIPVIMEEETQYYRKKWPFDFDEYYCKLEQQMQELFISVYYGINIEIHHTLIDFLQKQNLHEAVQQWSLEKIDPILARRIRRFVIRYQFFNRPVPVFNENQREEMNNYRDQLTRYQKDIIAFESYIQQFFRQTFPKYF